MYEHIFRMTGMLAERDPRDAVMWLEAHRPSLVTDADLQKIYSINEACLSAIRARGRDAEASGFDFAGRVAAIRQLCAKHIAN